MAHSSERLQSTAPACPAALQRVPCCGVCALPLLEPDVPQTRFAGGSYHVPCVNLYANLVDAKRVPRADL